MSTLVFKYKSYLFKNAFLVHPVDELITFQEGLDVPATKLAPRLKSWFWFQNCSAVSQPSHLGRNLLPSGHGRMTYLCNTTGLPWSGVSEHWLWGKKKKSLSEKSGCLFLESHFCFVSWFLFECGVVKHCLMLLLRQPHTEVSRTHWQSNHGNKTLHHLILPDENRCFTCNSAEKFLKTSLWRSFYSHSF